MHVLHELVCGIRGAENGSVDIYRRGTSTRVTYYTSFEGDGSTTPTSATTLDSNGGGEFYVNETVDVVVRDSSGTEVRRFTSAPAASAVEVISQSFTGTDYDSAATGASKPLALSTALDMLYTSFGARDFNVLFGGASTSMQTAISGVGTLFFNVKSPTYGAVGDGATNDTAAIQAALDAASAAGGGLVFFPRGTYRTTATLTVPATVSLLGQGPAASIIQLDVGAATDTLTMSAASVMTTISRLKFSAAQANNANAIDCTAGRVLLVEDCVFDGSNRALAHITAAGSSTIYVSRCDFTLHATAASESALLASAAGTSIMHVYGCKFALAGTFNINAVTLYAGSLISCEFSLTAVTASAAGALVSFNNGATGLVRPGVMIGCSSDNPTGGTIAALSQVNGRWNDGVVVAGNRFGSSVTYGPSVSDSTAATYVGEINLDREPGRYRVATDADASIPAGTYSYAEVVRSTNANQTLTLPNPGRVGMGFTLNLNNNAVGSASGTITMSANVLNLSPFTVDANRSSFYYFQSVHTATSEYWVMLGSAVNLVA